MSSLEAYLPLCEDANENDSKTFAEVVDGNKRRKFIVFDEYLNFYLNVKDADIAVKRFVVYINDNKLVSLQFDECFNKVDKNSNTDLFKLNNNFFKKYLFKSSIVMNNGHNNKIIFRFYYSEEKMDTESLNNSTGNETRYLESFKEVDLFDEPTDAGTLQRKPNLFTKDKEFTVEFPIYSPLNMRLRNITIYENNKDRIINNGIMVSSMNNSILTSLDLQISKQLDLLIEKYYQKEEQYGLIFNDIKVSILNDDDIDIELAIKPIDDYETIQFPLKILNDDSYSIIYKLPELFVNSSERKRIKVKVNINYNLLINDKLKLFDIHTSWESDISIKATSTPTSASLSTISNTTPNNSQLNIQTPRLTSGRFINHNSMSKLNNISFKFLQDKIVIKKGVEFTVLLQVINNSQFPLDTVVYYNNSNKQVNSKIILLSNDYKIPIIQPKETYFVNLKFIAISTGFVQYLNGLKLLDLQTSELVEIGNSLSVLIQ